MPAEQISVGIGLAARRTQVHTLTVLPSGPTETRRPKPQERSRPRSDHRAEVRDSPTPERSQRGVVELGARCHVRALDRHMVEHAPTSAIERRRRPARSDSPINRDRGRRPSATPGGPKATRSGNPPNRKTATPADPHHPSRTRVVRLVADPAFPGSRGGVFDALALGTQAIPHRLPPSPRRPGENKRKTWGFSASAGQDEDPQGPSHRQGCHHDAEPGRLGDRRGGARCRRRPQPQDPGQ